MFLFVQNESAPGVPQGCPFDKINHRGASDREGPGAGDHPANDVAPAGKKFECGPCSLPQNHSEADICAQCADEFRRRAQAAFAPAEVHDSGDHDQLQGGENGEVSERDWLGADGGADRARRFHEQLRNFALGMNIAAAADQLDPGLVRQFAHQVPAKDPS